MLTDEQAEKLAHKLVDLVDAQVDTINDTPQINYYQAIEDVKRELLKVEKMV